MRLDGVFAHENTLGDLPGAQTGGDQLQDFQLTWSDAERLDPGVIADEFHGRGDHHLTDDDRLAMARQPETEPDAECGEHRRDEPTVDLDRVLDHQPSVLDQTQDRDEDAGEEPVTEYVLHWRSVAKMAASSWGGTTSSCSKVQSRGRLSVRQRRNCAVWRKRSPSMWSYATW